MHIICNNSRILDYHLEELNLYLKVLTKTEKYKEFLNQILITSIFLSYVLMNKVFK
jgi:hypothetical protein